MDGTGALPEPHALVTNPEAEPYAAVAETHSAVVFFAGPYACKLKKPVDLGFLNFTTPRSRETACQRETELNRRFAPGVYLGTAEIRGPAGVPGDHMVVMRRMPAGRRLSTLVRSGAPVTGPLRQVARKLAAAHAASPRSPRIARQGSRDALAARWNANLEQAAALAGSPLDPSGVDEVRRLAGRFLDGRDPLFERRIREGRIVDGHGDLLADDIFCLDEGPQILDCLEFDDRLRWLDGLDDAAFLAMDLEWLGAPVLAGQFTGWYAEFSADPAPPSLHHHYVAYRAFVRAKVSALRAAQGERQSAARARSLTAIALRHLHAGAVTFALIGGLPGTGKTTLAGTLASRLGFTLLSSDRIRKELAGLPPEAPAAAPWQAGIYLPASTERTYTELLARAAALLAAGESVIADASWISPRQRSAAAATAEATAADLVQLQCTAPADLAARRLLAHPGGSSDADPRIAAHMAAAWAPWPQAVSIDTSGTGPGPAGDPVPAALAAIRPHEPGHLWRPTRPYMVPG
jgi:uncharacterized protein